jgi:hypothetical protein
MMRASRLRRARNGGGDVDITLAKIGIVCIIAAIVGGGLKAANIEFGPLESTGRQILLASFGLVLIFTHWLRDRGDETASQARGETPRMLLIIGGILLGTAFAALLNVVVGAVKVGALNYEAIMSNAKAALIQGHVIELGAILGAVCGACWSLLERRQPGATATMVIAAGAILGLSGHYLNPPGVTVETPTGIVFASAFGGSAAIVVMLVLRRLRV